MDTTREGGGMTLIELAQPIVGRAVLTASVDAEGEATVVTLHGEADVATLPVVVDVLARVIADFDGPVIVDLADTRFIDIHTMATIARARQLLHARERTLTLRAPSRVALRVVELLGLAHAIERSR